MSRQQQTTITTIRRQLPCRLTEPEINRAAMAAAQYATEYKEVEATKKAYQAEYTERLKDLRASLQEQSQMAMTGEETRPVDCQWIILREDCKKRLVRLDTGEMIEEAELTAKEMQQSFLDD